MTPYQEQQKRWAAMGYRCPECGSHVPTQGHPEGCPGEKTGRKGRG